MFDLKNLTASANQTTTVVLQDGSTLQLTFKYRPAIQRWSIDLSYKNFKANGVGLATHPNLLRIWRNVIPFGIQVATADGTDPFMADDLASGRVTVTILDGTAGRTDLLDAEAVINA